jgi:hypothetical protein
LKNLCGVKESEKSNGNAIDCPFCRKLNGMKFFGSNKKTMNQIKDVERNRPAEKGRDNDPHIRDESAEQPGVNTMSGSDTDDANEKLTKTAGDNFREKAAGDEHADKRFDE